VARHEAAAGFATPATHQRRRHRFPYAMTPRANPPRAEEAAAKGSAAAAYTG